MGVRAHVQVRHPEYGNCELSSWAESAFERMLEDYDCTAYNTETDNWEIELDDNLLRLRDRLKDDASSFDSYLAEDLRGNGYGKDLADLLEEGISSADENGYSFILIDWW